MQTQTGIARIDAAFAGARARARTALIPYLCAGDPDLETSLAMLLAAGEAGADIVEIGIPYGDPLADGPTIASAAHRALQNGTVFEAVLDLAARAHAAGAPPSLLFTYVNPVLRYGVERFAQRLVDAGACGAIVPDVPLEEAAMIRAAFEPHGLAFPLLIAPSTPPARAAYIARASSGFTYIVSRLGVTSAAREPDFRWIAERVESLRAQGLGPFAIGFGIANAAHVREAGRLADGAIVGSALIDAYAGTTGARAVSRVREFVTSLSAATVR